MSSKNNEVLFEERKGKEGALGIITLNRPHVLNSLNHAMVKAIDTHLTAWESSPKIKAVIIRAAEGRAFCAGGDIRHTYECMKSNTDTMSDFFRDEYQLNKKIFHYTKPYIALLNGITMGGGVGISIHGSHRVATDQLIFAMPETGIGFFPDVGGTYFLPRIDSHLGYYLGLTGSKIGIDECVHMGIATLKVPTHSLDDITDALLQHALSENNANTDVTHILNSFRLPISSTPLIDAQEDINACFNANTMEEIIDNVQQSQNHICQKSAAMLLKKSPTSLKVSLKAMQQGQQLDFDKCMRQEFRLVNRFLREHDFIEGIRAVIIDKDQKPHWKPSSLEMVTQTEVDDYFKPLMEELV